MRRRFMSACRYLIGPMAAISVCALGDAAMAACSSSGFDQNCINDGTMTDGLVDGGSLTLVNNGVISTSGVYGSVAVLAGSARITNNAGGVIVGTAPGGAAILGYQPTSYDISNYGLILGAISASGAVNLSNHAGGIIRMDVDTSLDWQGQTNFQAVTVAGFFGQSTIYNAGQVSVSISGPADTLRFGTALTQYDIATVNDGTISATVNYGYATGILASMSGLNTTNPGNSILNRGTIGAYTRTGVAFGIYMASFGPNSATVVNYGTISGRSDDGLAYGIDYSGFGCPCQGVGTAVLTNRGIISGSTAAVRLETGGNTINAYAGSRFINGIDFSGQPGNTINLYASSYTLGVQNYLVGANTVSVHGSNSVLTYGLDGTGTGNIYLIQTAPLFAVSAVMPAFAGFASDALADATSGVPAPPAQPLAFQTMPEPGATPFDRLFAYGEPASSARKMPAQPPLGEGTFVDGYGNRLWSRAFVGMQLTPTSGATVGRYGTYFGSMLGYDQGIGDWRIGGFLGYGYVAASMLDASANTKSDLYFGGIYANRLVGSVMLRAALMAGGLADRSSRSVNAGTETASGTYGGWFLSPELAAAYDHRLGGGWTLTPTLRARYTGTYLNGYTETGSSQNIAYSGRWSGALAERLELRLAYKGLDDRGLASTFYVQAAALANQRTGSGNLAASVTGISFTATDPTARSVVGAELGLGFEHRMTRAVSLTGAIDGALYSDRTSSLAGRLGLKVAF